MYEQVSAAGMLQGAMCDRTTEARERQVPCAMQRLSSELNRLHEQLFQMTTQLRPVLAHQQNKPTTPVDAKNTVEPCTLWEAIDLRARQVETANVILSDLIGRLEL